MMVTCEERNKSVDIEVIRSLSQVPVARIRKNALVYAYYFLGHYLSDVNVTESFSRKFVSAGQDNLSFI